MQCPACGATASPRARFCDQCGAQLITAPVDRTTDGAEAGDRRVVTALFADIVDYVRMIAEHDAEEVRTRVGLALRQMAEAIEHLEGTREKFIGDAVFAVFGWPRAHDDDAIRAALAALAIRASLRDPGDGAEPIEVRIGLATGEVVTGPRGHGTGDLAIAGEAITTAARIQSLARPGEILVDEATVRAGRDRLSVEDRGSVVLRGQSSAVHLYALTGEQNLAAPSLTRARPDGPLVGRTDELARVSRILRQSRRTGRGAVVLISGDAGVGKSRLVAEIESDARALGFAWTWTENASYGRGEPYRFARSFAQAIADEHDVDSGTYARQLLFEPGMDEATIRRYGGAIAAIARAAVFSGWEAEEAHLPDDPAETAAILGEVATTYLQRLLATDGPRVVVLDDVQWIDTSSAGMVELIVASAATEPVVVLATMRPGPIPDWAYLPHVERFELAGLAPSDTARLATIVARAALDAHDARRIHDRTEGNPLFIGETVRASIEDGTLELRHGRMMLVEAGSPRLPLTLRAVLGVRIDGLDEEAREILGVASVIGIAFDSDALADLLDRPVAPEAIDRLVAATLIVPVDQGAWRFSHPLVHDAAYVGILASRRRRLHGRLADRLETGQIPATAVAVAVHRAASGDAVNAVPLLDEAAISALAVGAAVEAAGFWRTAADLSTDPVTAARFREAAESALGAARRQRRRRS